MRYLLILALAATPLIAQDQPRQPVKPEGDTIVGNWTHLEKTPGQDPAEGRIKVPAGFHVNVFASNLEHARMMLTLEDGTVLLTRPRQNDVLSLRDTNADGVADRIDTVASALPLAHGLTFRDNKLYVIGETKIWSIARQADGWGDPEVIASDLPTGGQHPNRTIAFGPDGFLYASIGSTCNACAETDPESATLLQMEPDGSNRRIYASGLRNTIGFDWHPQTNELWGLDHGSDWRGDDLPPEEVNRIVDGGNYGWPYCFGKQVVDDTRPDPANTTKQKFCSKSNPSQLDLPAHAAPIGFAFYRGTQFPQAYRQDGFAVLRGSWNREKPRQPKIVRLRFQNGKPAGSEDFVTGFVMADGKTHNGRLAGITVGHDGSLLFSDDQNGVVYRVSHGAPPTMTSSAPAPETMRALTRVFRTEQFRKPESVLHDEEQDVYFVSNIDGESLAKDGNGFISKLTPAGQITTLRFIEGLHAPKGMAIRGEELWVTDIDTLRSFNRRTGRPLSTLDLKAQGAVFLNDLTVGSDGAIYVSDMAVTMENGSMKRTKTDRIYRIGSDGTVSIAAQGEGLRAPNGLAWMGDRLVIAQNYGKSLITWAPNEEARILATGPGAFDGVVALADGRLLVSSHHDNAIHVLENGELKPLLPRPPAPGDIGFDRTRNRLLIPSLEGDWVEGWTLPPM
jgi:glucose/arabinose dehydrogenase